MDKNNQNTSNQEPTVEKKRKSRFGMVVGVVLVVLAITFAFLALSQKDNYKVLDSSSKEVSSKIAEIKDIRTIKGYKILGNSGKYKLVLISAGLSYDKEGKIEVASVDFKKDSAVITVKESINKNPEVEKVTYPYIMVKLDGSIDDIAVVNTDGEVYEEIFINGEEGSVENKQDAENPSEEVKEESDLSKEEQEEQEQEEEQEEDVEEEVKEEVESEPSSVKTLTCVYQGRIDANSVEVSVGDTYRTFDVTKVQNSFKNVEIGQQITVEYIDFNEGQQIVSVK